MVKCLVVTEYVLHNVNIPRIAFTVIIIAYTNYDYPLLILSARLPNS